MRFQRISQACSLMLFLALLALAGHPYPLGLQADLFLRLDPVLGIGTMISARALAVAFVPGILLVLAGLVLGRFFCGHICPMGTTLDVFQVSLPPKRKTNSRNNSFEASSRFRIWKYLGLIFIFTAAIAGVSLVHLGSPLSLITRFYSVVVWPILLLAADTTLYWLAPLFSRAGFHEALYIHVAPKVFATNVFVALAFLGIAGLAYIQPRFWCRNLCPAGGLMALFARRPLIRRTVDESCTGCGLCIARCPTGAISEDPLKTVHNECVVCLRCTEVCPESAIAFTGARHITNDVRVDMSPSRRHLIVAGATGLLTAGLLRTGIAQPRTLGKESAVKDALLIRPPGALPEPDFLTTCVRCGECMKACPTNTLQPIWLTAGLEGIFSPVMTPRLGPCAVNCNVCGQVCPTGAIRKLPLIEKQHAKVGTAWIVRRNCLVWEQDKKCLVCDEVCPYNALSFRPVPGRRNAAPFVVENRCLGCGWCETKCPVKGAAAIRVNVMGELRLSSTSYVKKSREFGLVFRTKDNSLDRLAPQTFDQLDGTTVTPSSPEPVPSKEGDLPPGFTLK
jgi:MauM/NapG family ferredoxin protein